MNPDEAAVLILITLFGLAVGPALPGRAHRIPSTRAAVDILLAGLLPNGT